MSGKDADNAKQSSISLSEVQLVEALRNYDENAFMALVDQYQATMVRIAQRYVGDMETAKEVVQETWLAILRGVEQFEGRATFKTWLFTILLNRARTRGKQKVLLVSLHEWGHEQGTEEDERDWVEQRYRAEGRTVGMPLISLAMSTPEEQILNQEVQACMEQAILQLPIMQRAVIILHDMEGWTVDEICLILGLSEGNQRVLLHRARVKIRHALESYLTER